MSDDNYDDDDKDEPEEEDENPEITWIKDPNWGEIGGDEFGEEVDLPNIEKMINYFLNQFNFPNKPGSPNEPAVWGFSMSFGPDKKPIIKRMGRLNPKKLNKPSSEKQEPLIDVIETADEITIIAEILGVKESDIKVIPTERTVKILVDIPSMKYFNEVDCPCLIIPKTAEFRYKNGILEIQLKKKLE